MFLTILIPVYDEVEAIGPLEAALGELPRLLVPHDAFFELVFLDDGSRDGSRQLLHEVVDRTLAPARVLGFDRNRGFGAMIRDAAGLLGGEVVVVYDADRPYPLEELPRMLERLRAGADVVTASPWGRGGAAEGVPAHREGLSRALSWLYRLRLGRRARHLHTFSCAFRAWKREAFDACLPRCDRFGATTEMLLRALRKGLVVEEIPSTLRTRSEGRSKMRIARTVWTHLGLLLRGG